MALNDINKLLHTSWNCKYHIVFAAKYRRIVFYKNKKTEVGKILRKLCEWKGVNIIEAEVCQDHIHILVEIPPKMSISSFMGTSRGKVRLCYILLIRQTNHLTDSVTIWTFIFMLDHWKNEWNHNTFKDFYISIGIYVIYR